MDFDTSFDSVPLTPQPDQLRLLHDRAGRIRLRPGSIRKRFRAAQIAPRKIYTYGLKRLEVLAAFTNTLFLLFLAFSLSVEALHAFVQDESEHKHYLIVSAIANLAVNLMGVWFFRNYARVRFVYKKAEDMNNHSICLHVLSDSIRSAGVILASLLLALGPRFRGSVSARLTSVQSLRRIVAANVTTRNFTFSFQQMLATSWSCSRRNRVLPHKVLGTSSWIRRRKSSS